MSTLAQLPWGPNQVRPEVTSSLATGAAVGVWNLSSALGLQTEQLLWNAATGHLRGLRSQGHPCVVQGGRTTPLQYPTHWIPEVWRSGVGIDQPETLMSCTVPLDWTTQHTQVTVTTSHRCPRKSWLLCDAQWRWLREAVLEGLL